MSYALLLELLKCLLHDLNPNIPELDGGERRFVVELLLKHHSSVLFVEDFCEVDRCGVFLDGVAHYCNFGAEIN